MICLLTDLFWSHISVPRRDQPRRDTTASSFALRGFPRRRSFALRTSSCSVEIGGPFKPRRALEVDRWHAAVIVIFARRWSLNMCGGRLFGCDMQESSEACSKTKAQGCLLSAIPRARRLRGTSQRTHQNPAVSSTYLNNVKERRL